jgi:demethylmenaquinone methyltransferase/2-methoxy-6-polyprenyl-1,4-benzoquinol methylase
MSKTVSFEGRLGGAAYDRLSALTGYGPSYYRRAAAALPIRSGDVLVDLGCGTGSLALAVADRLRGRGRVTGIDLAERQLAEARRKGARSPVPIEWRRGSVDDLPFEDGTVDGVCMSQVIHGLTEPVRRGMIAESVRVLRPGGFFGLVEWSRPGFGWAAAVWTWTILGMRDSRNWQGTLGEWFVAAGFEPSTDVRLDSLNRCEVFRKLGETRAAERPR